MKFKTDGSSINQIALAHSVENLSKVVSVLDTILQQELSDGNDIVSNIEVLVQAIRMKTEACFYIFHVLDGLSSSLGDWEEEWIAIYQRIWNQLRSIKTVGSSSIIRQENLWEYIKEFWINDVYTWEIDWNFLGIERMFRGSDFTIETRWLVPNQVEFIKPLWVNVRVLSILK